jgi:hypothetical protein
MDKVQEPSNSEEITGLSRNFEPHTLSFGMDLDLAMQSACNLICYSETLCSIFGHPVPARYLPRSSMNLPNGYGEIITEPCKITPGIILNLNFRDHFYDLVLRTSPFSF